MTHTMQITSKYFVAVLLVTLTQAALSIDKLLPLLRTRRDDSKIENRLPDNIIINSYKLRFNIVLNGDNLTFNGVSEININVRKPANSITLHVEELEIKPGVDIKCDKQTDVAISKVEPPFNNTTVILKIIFTRNLHVGSNCNLTIAYNVRNAWNSLQHNEYETSTGEKSWVIGHLMAANKLFPYWDDQNFRMNFIISIRHSKNYVALSNMHVVGEDVDPENPEWIITHFAKSPKMSIDNVKFIIGDIIKTNNNSEGFRVWNWRDSFTLPNFIQEVGPKLIKALDDYTNLPFEKQGLKKLDLVLIKELPLYAAVSSWGIMVFEDGDLYVYNHSPSSAALDIIIQAMAHEISHQWFGNLLDIASLNYVWLMEGFATYLQYVITDKIKPTWRIMDKFVTENIHTKAFEHDAKLSSLPMEWDTINSENSNVYHKSATVIRMISYVLGEDKFKTALRNYIKTKAFGITTSEEFFDELVKVCPKNKNLPKILKNWVTTRGYPIINVDRDYEAEKAIIMQSRFFEDINEISIEKYWVAINYVTDDNLNFNDTNVTHWFDPSVHSIEIDQLKEHQFIILNKQQFGYYRVNYDERNWELIINYLTNEDHSRIHVLNRAQLIDDAFNLAKVGHLEYKVLFSLLGYLKQETDFVPWSVAWRVIEHIYSEVINTEVEEAFKHYVLKLSNKLEHVLFYIEVDNITDHIIDQKKSEALMWTCLFGSRLCRANAEKIFQKWIEDPENSTVPELDLNRAICTGLSYSKQKLPDTLRKQFYTAIIQCPLDTDILKKFLSRSIAQISTYDWCSINLYFISGRNANSVTAALEYISENYNKIIAYHDFTHDMFEKDMLTLSHKIRNKIQRDDLKAIIGAYKSSFKNGDQILAKVDNNLKKINEEIQVFKEFFKNK